METVPSLFSLEGKVAAVTGVSRGLGQAMAVALAQAGADVVGIGFHGMDQTKGQVEALGRRAVSVQADLSQSGRMPDVAARAIAAFGRVDVLVNNAGIIRLDPAEEIKEADFDAVMAVNLRALFLLTREIGRQMIARGGGKIINICSVQSIKGGFDDAAYVASKHAVAGLTKALANEWGRYHICVNGIAPGFMVTDNTAKLRTQKEKVAAINAQIPLGRWGQPADLMGPVIFLASAASDYVNGHLLVADGGYLNC
ncbi:MAG: SDR family oxidoreductase [Intestinimonas sp.]|jgi:2-deoxy-D-gluconate 3-dehydrogenase|nr:SDR family oxidoreductase [Intestinimonas sp.]